MQTLAESAAELAWSSLPALSQLHHTLPPQVEQECLEAATAAIPEDPMAFSSAELSSDTQSFLADLRSRLMHGPGVAILRPSATTETEHLRILYAVVCRSLGTLNDRYGYFFDVIDRSKDHTKEAIPVSVTNAATGYHTDSTARTYFPDVVGLLCLASAAEGGESLIANAASMYLHIVDQYPHLTPWLTEPLPRDVITPGFANTINAISENLIPLFATDNHGLYFRFMRYWIDTAFMKLRRRQPSELTETLDRIDGYFSSPNCNLQFSLQRGDLLFVNNRFLCHNRTAFRDNGEPRRLVRAWISVPPDDSQRETTDTIA